MAFEIISIPGQDERQAQAALTPSAGVSFAPQPFEAAPQKPQFTQPPAQGQLEPGKQFEIISLGDEQSQPKNEGLSFGVGVAQSVAQGLALGFFDEAFAAGRSIALGTNYEDELKTVRDNLDAFQAANPGVALTAEIAGGFLLPGLGTANALKAGAGLVRAASKGAKVGAITGATAGVGQGRSMEDRIQSGITGGVVGGIAGGILTPTAQIAGRGIQTLRRSASDGEPLQEGIDTIARQANRAETNLNELQDTVGRTETPLNMIDLAELAEPGGSRALAGTARAAASVPGRGQVQAQRLLDERQIGQRDEVNSFIDDAFGAADFEQTSRRLTQEIQEVSRANYSALHQQPAVRIDDELRAFLSETLIARQLPAARELARADGAGLLDNALSGNQISVKTLDYLQRAMRENSSGPPNSRKVAIGKLRRRFNNALDNRIEGFRDTRQRYADGKASQQALDLGQKFTTRINANQRGALHAFERMSLPERDMFRLGVARALRDTIDNAPAGRNVADQFTTRAAQGKLNRVLGEDRARRFLNEMQALDQQSRTRNSVLSGSRTTPLAEEIAEQRELAETAANIATLNIRGLGRNVVNRLTRGISAKNSEAVLKVLLESDPNEVRSLMNQISAAQRKIRKSQKRQGVAGSIAGSIAGQQAGASEGRRRAERLEN